jgi:tetratricopeptide (TPR) repeat protein
VHGLASRPELNGACGMATRYDASKGRYEVELEGQAEPVLLRATSLQPPPRPQPPQPSSPQPPPPPPPPPAAAAPAGSSGGGGGGGGSGSGSGAPAAPSATAEKWKAEGDARFRESEATQAWGAYAAAIGAAGAASASGVGGAAHWLAIVYGNRSAASLSLGCATQATADAQRSVRCDGQWAKAHARLAAALAAQADAEGAARAYRRALGLEENARWREALRGLASGSSRADSLERGPATAGGPPDETAARPAEAEAAKARGNAAFQAGRHAEAAGLYTAALGLLGGVAAAPHSNGAGRERAVLLSNRCAALVGLGVVGGEALADARGAVLADPSFLKGYLRLGNVLLDRGDWADAVDALKEGLAVDPTHAQLQAALERAVRSSHG